MKISFLTRLFVAGLMALPCIAEAHTGPSHVVGFMSGLLHPLSGLDHVLAMLAIGLWATQMGGRAVWAVPFSFVAAMAVGSILPLPFAESGIILSLLLLGVLVATFTRLPLWLGCILAGLFAICHGHAHGVEMPAMVSGKTYYFGFLLSTLALHVAGVMTGLAAKRLSGQRAITAAGSGIALYGLYLLAM